MTYTDTKLIAGHGLFSTAVVTAGTAITALKT